MYVPILFWKLFLSEEQPNGNSISSGQNYLINWEHERKGMSIISQII